VFTTLRILFFAHLVFSSLRPIGSMLGMVEVVT
jgi:hypothetical protein